MKLLENRRRIFPLAVIGLTGGAVLAESQQPAARDGIPLSVQWRKPAPKKRAPQRAEWRRRADLAKAKQHGAALVQRTTNGTRITYTINAELQRRTRAMLRKYKVPYGAVAMYRVKTGEVLVLAGHSTQRPADGGPKLALRPWAPAASVYKIVTAAALLENGVPATRTVCHHGGLRGLTWSNLRPNRALDRTCNTLSTALARSINPVFGKLALRHLNRRRMQGWSRRFGFNQNIPFELETTPSRAEIPADDLERARVAAGFWHTELSVLHAAALTGVVANRGVMRWPHIVKRVQTRKGHRLRTQRPRGRRILSPHTARALTKMMIDTTETGTGRRGFRQRSGRPYLPGIRVAGKTGSLSRALQYSWFVGFAPAKRPEVAFAVLLGNLPKWHIKASTAARLLLSDYLALR